AHTCQGHASVLAGNLCSVRNRIPRTPALSTTIHRGFSRGSRGIPRSSSGCRGCWRHSASVTAADCTSPRPKTGPRLTPHPDGAIEQGGGSHAPSSPPPDQYLLRRAL